MWAGLEITSLAPRSTIQNSTDHLSVRPSHVRGRHVDFKFDCLPCEHLRFGDDPPGHAHAPNRKIVVRHERCGALGVPTILIEDDSGLCLDESFGDGVDNEVALQADKG